MLKKSKAIMHIIKRYGGKRLKKENKFDFPKYEFPTSNDAGMACWEIHGTAGRECVAVNHILTIYT